MNNKINLNELISEIKLVLSDEFIALISNEENGFVMQFTNGQSFRVLVEAK